MPITVLSVDPGITTGYCLATVDRTTIDLWPHQEKYDVAPFYSQLDKHGPDHIILEDFEYRKSQRDGLILFSVQLIGVTRLWGKWKTVPVTMQSAAKGKGFYSNDQLKLVGAYKRGIPHAMDATRHLMHWLTFGAGFQYADPDKATITLH
jgi:hypothetical protein